MSFGAGGTYTQVSGAITAAAGQVIQSAVWNNIHADLGNALTALGTCLVTSPTPRNILHANGGLELWQRGAGGAASIAVGAGTTAYGADRWYLTTGANQAHVVSQQAGLNAASQWCAQVQRTAGQTGVTAMTFGYPLDTEEVVRMRGKKVGLAFLAATGANWSPASGTLVATLYVGTGAAAKRGAGFTGETNVLSVSSNIAAGTSAAAYGGISSAVVPANATQGEVQFTWTPTGTAGTNDWFQLDDVMLDSSAAASQGLQVQYERLPFDFQLAACRQHFWKTFGYSVAPAQAVGAGTGELMAMAGKAGAAAQFLPFRHPVRMRATPALTLYSPATTSAQVYDETAGSYSTSSSYSGLTTEGGYVTATGAAGAAVGDLLGVHITVDAGI